MKILIVALLSHVSFYVLADTSKQEWCNRAHEDRAIYLKYPDMAPYAPQTSNVLSPFKKNTPLNELTPSKIARMLSGYYCDSPNSHPLIYASSDGFTVVGVGFNKVYPLNKLSEAVVAYEKLLISSGYTK